MTKLAKIVVVYTDAADGRGWYAVLDAKDNYAAMSVVETWGDTFKIDYACGHSDTVVNDLIASGITQWR